MFPEVSVPAAELDTPLPEPSDDAIELSIAELGV
jgi:hypothetical protein